MPMITNDMLARGVADGIITAEQAERLRALDNSSEPLDLPSSPDDEQLRFVSGFSDVFVTLGLAMFVGAVGYFIDRSYGGAAMWIGVAVITWLLAEFFTRKRRMALPSIVLLIGFAAAAFIGLDALLAGLFVDHGGRQTPSTAIPLGIDGAPPTVMAVAALLTVLLTAAHYWRFRVPITIAAGCAALTIAVVGLAYSLIPQLASVGYAAVIFVCSLAVFALAMRFDMSDPERLTRRTDIAFWLHLLAAPLIVHSLIRGLLVDPTRLDPASAVAIMVVFLALSLVAVLIDRRAMLVSGLAYTGYAFATLFRAAGFSDITTPATLLVLGAFVLLLSAGWRPLRAAVWRVTPSVLTRRLPRLSVQTT
ncbi:hypothetical protein [Bradyrhizobium prioriisuperbiae]|uniref:hypothetical protein n=1 Tax=Bradyrhizobium prioriisuperbiae TaxID=2854389 RepID=UPI0028F13253|nr:hypothetical protein [Bradyrhizobium prioritasuperba]